MSEPVILYTSIIDGRPSSFPRDAEKRTDTLLAIQPAEFNAMVDRMDLLEGLLRRARDFTSGTVELQAEIDAALEPK